MTTLNIVIPGSKIENASKDNTGELIIDETFIIGDTARGEPERLNEVQLNENKLVEFTFEDNSVWFGDHTTLDEIFPGTAPELRSIENDPGAKAFVLPTAVYSDESNRSGLLSKVVVKLVKIFVKKTLLASKVKELAGSLEKKKLENRSGLYTLTSDFKFEKVAFTDNAKYLLFLHGTASSTSGSFEELKGSSTWNYIHQAFNKHVLAFEHETLTKSPLENVLDLVSLLPAKATFTVISHSRGGLVGDVLNRYCLNETSVTGFSAKEKNYLRKHGREDDIQLIEKIEKAMLGKNITIDKFIRVACTASGTTLASRRLNIYFNVIFNLLGLATAQSANPIYISFKELIAALIESKDDASVLPGLEVQNPRSPFNQMLNNANPDTVITTPLVIISGDSRMSLSWQGMKVALSNLFYWGDNDFVVDTRSMYNGARRAPDTVQYFFDEGVSVSHFKYFANEKTQSALLLALRNTENSLIPGFSRLETRAFTDEEIRNINISLPGGRVFENNVSGKKPIVVLLPGIMGSTLSVGDKHVWINFLGFISGNLGQLQYNEGNNKNVKADGLVGSSYKKLTEYLKRDYDVVTFPFDWRGYTADGAAALNRKLEALMDYGRPIKLIGHSMGGVLIRDFIINHPTTWDKLKRTQGFRLIFLGTPLMGSFRIPYVLFGKDALIKTLDIIDLSSSEKELLSMFSNFPGILSLLPLTTSNGNDFANQATWIKMRDAFQDVTWPIPGTDALNEFKKYRSQVLDRLADTKNPIDFGDAVYIAGQARRGRQTISGYQISQKNGKPVLEFLATREGDESVTWDSGIPLSLINEKNIYYTDVTHGELANDPKLFAPIADLLSNSNTPQLKRTRPAVRALEKEFKAKEIFDYDLSASGVEKSLLGLGTENRFSSGNVPISVSVSNGDLKYAAYPLMVGHFENDGITSAEKAVDWHLRGELRRRYLLGLYPGSTGTTEIISSLNGKGFQGGIIVGLGRQGLLTEYRLTHTIEQGTAKYLAQLNSKSDIKPKTDLKTEKTGISALLIGSGFGGLRIENAVRAILQGIQNANAKVRYIYDSPKVIDTVEFVELYKDRASACVKVIGAIERDENQSFNILLSGRTIKKLPGFRERLPIDDTTQWWTRITVRKYTDEDKKYSRPANSLLFTISTDAARVEERSLRTLNETLTGMLEAMSTNDEWSPELAKSIFELMIPNDFKDQVKRQSNINWVLDKYTAAFPWELLQDSVVNARPLSVNAGMIRQLATGSYRINVTPVVEQTAIVIGDPDLQNPQIQLPAAFREGEKVAELLSLNNYEVNKILKGTAAQILRNLFSKNYKIVHLAGHGIFNEDPDQPTGMLIGPNAYLTPAYIDQMSSVPELVFVNCCYLGKTDGNAEQYHDRFRLAANIGTQLIEIGVKAVVVAGWAVNDSAALDFAERFYEAMFEGFSFGDAIRKARKTIFESYGPRNNTWGAYQCYGDPHYILFSNSGKSKQPFDFIIPEEAEIELSNLLNKVERGGYDEGEIVQTMDDIETALTKTSIRSGRITELQAFLYTALNEYGKALDKFEALLREEKAAFSFSATEKYCNTQVKLQALLVKNAKEDRPKVIKDAIDVITETILKLEALNRFGETVERTNLLGSAYKRLAMVSSGDQKVEAYDCSISFYTKAFENSNNNSKYYPLTNLLSIINALVLSGKRDWGEKNRSKRSYQSRLKEEFQKLDDKQDQELDYWDWIGKATILLCQRQLGDTEVKYENILEQYTGAWSMIGSEGQRQAEIEHLEFLEDALLMAGDKAKDLLEEVTRLRINLEVLF